MPLTHVLSRFSEWRESALGPGMVLEICREALWDSFATITVHEDLETVYARLYQAFRDGELMVLAMPHPVADSDKVAEKEVETALPPPRAQAKTWVEFRLVREWDGTPVADASYRLKLPDGSSRTGRLDQTGSVRVTDIDPGMCEISFLDHDQSEWHPA
jgi:hypothetical protein